MNDTELELNDRLAIDRTRLAAERRRYVRELGAIQPRKSWDLALIVAYLLALLGLLMLGSIIFGSGPQS